MNANLKFYPDGSPQENPENGIGFNVDTSFKTDPQLGDKLPSDGFDITQGGLGVTVEYDGRNNTFTPSEGLRATF